MSPLGVVSTEVPPFVVARVDGGGKFTSLVEPPTSGRLKKATFTLPLEDKQLIIDALYTWKSAYKKNFTRGFPQTVRDWTRIERILHELEGE